MHACIHTQTHTHTHTHTHTPRNLACNGVFELCSTMTSCKRSLNNWLTLFKWIIM